MLTRNQQLHIRKINRSSTLVLTVLLSAGGSFKPQTPYNFQPTVIGGQFYTGDFEVEEYFDVVMVRF